MPLKLIAPPPVEPVTSDEVKAFARVDFDDEDEVFDSLIAAAREHVEQVTGRQLVQATYDYELTGDTKLSKSEKFALKLGRLSPHAFEQVKDRLCSQGDAMKRKQGAAKRLPEQSEDEQRLDAMSDGAFEQFREAVGAAGGRFDIPLLDALKRKAPRDE